MAHGSKRWIYAIDSAGGRAKRSRHRSNEDKLGRLAIGATVRKTDRSIECDICRAEAGEFNLWSWEKCSTCRAEAAARRRAGWNEWAWLRHAPKSFRREIEKRYRARLRELIVSERFDELPQQGPRDAAWDYW